MGQWSDRAPFYAELLAADLDAASLPAWLQRWSELTEHMGETAARLYAGTSGNTADQALAEAQKAFDEKIVPEAAKAYNALTLKLLASGLGYPGMQEPLRRMRAWSELYREENLPLEVQLSALQTEYTRVQGSMLARFEGATYSLTGMHRFLQVPERSRREAAWRAMNEARRPHRSALDGIYDRMLALRHRMALNAGHPRYTDYRFKEFCRFEYSPEDCLVLHAAIAETAGPLAMKIQAFRLRELELDRIQPWDVAVNVLGEVPPRPAQDVEALKDGVRAMLGKAIPGTARHFDRMRAAKTLDLEDRPNKAVGGFCSLLPLSGHCLIFMSANGTPLDVSTLAHESGHAMHFMEALEHLPLAFQQEAPTECCEALAIAVELLTLAHLEVFYSPQEAARIKVDRLFSFAQDLGYIAAIDAFQHWAHEHPDASHSRRDAAAAAIATRLCPGVGWEEHPEYLATFWQRKEHVFVAPFYYIDYAIADLGALQVWRNSLKDPAKAAEGLEKAMTLGGTCTRAEFFEAAGAKFRFDRAILSELMGWLEQAINIELQKLGKHL